MVINKMHTSYFAKTKLLLDNGYNNLIAISGYIPDFYKKQMEYDYRLSRCIELAPKKDWFFRWKNGELNNDDYIKLYYETVLNKINLQELYNKLGDDAVLLCYEKPGVFCHRHLVADYFNKNLNLDIKEIKI